MEMQAGKLRVLAVTYNVAGLSPDPAPDLSTLLGLDPTGARDKLDDMPDMYIVGFQEVSVSPQNVLHDIVNDPLWMMLLKRVLNPRGFVCARSERLMGILLCLFTKPQHLCQLRSFDSSVVRLGFGSLLGNKGSVSIRFDVYGVSVAIVNVHLAPHDGMCERRVEQFEAVLERTHFDSSSHSSLLSCDYVIWLGDLNFRLSEIESVDNSEVFKLAKISSSSDATVALAKLLNLDELNSVRVQNRLLSKFVESPITFAPTYKMVVDCSQEYDQARRPAWTDRILYYRSNDSEQRHLAIDTNNYRSFPEYEVSDHHPVSLCLSLHVCGGCEVPHVEFFPLDTCFIGEDINVKFEVDTTLHTSSWDWVALFKAGFGDVRDYLTYVWAPQSSLSGSRYRIVSFAEYAVTSPGSYVVAYMAAGTGGVYGVSEPFSVQFRF